MQYQRANTAGGTYFFTINLANRKSTLLTDEVDKLKASLRRVKQNHPFRIDALVFLPEHLHIMLTLPAGDADFAKRIMLFKTGFSRQIPKFESISVSRHQKRERGIWQRRYWEHLIHDEDDYNRHIDYIHFNPVKHGYVTRAADWQYSSIHKYIECGILNADWGIRMPLANNIDFGERS